jgi:hypothetical protein
LRAAGGAGRSQVAAGLFLRASSHLSCGSFFALVSFHSIENIALAVAGDPDLSLERERERKWKRKLRESPRGRASVKGG